jgi:hypothetical protein
VAHIHISEDEWKLISIALDCALEGAWSGEDPELAEHLEEPMRRLKLRLAHGGDRNAVTEDELNAACGALNYATDPERAELWHPDLRTAMESLESRIPVEQVMHSIIDGEEAGDE